MNATENIVLGVVAGVLTSLLLAVAGVLVKQVVVPWYRELVYRGVDLEGTWASKASAHGASYDYPLVLTQSGHELAGTATITKAMTGGTGYRDAFRLSGYTWEGYVSLTLRSEDRRRLSFATALLRVEQRGGVLIGYWAYRGSHIDAVEAEQITLSRST